MIRNFHPGVVVLYRKQKRSVRPGPHARDIRPDENGDSYSYSVDKFWRVVDIRPDRLPDFRDWSFGGCGLEAGGGEQETGGDGGPGEGAGEVHRIAPVRRRRVS